MGLAVLVSRMFQLEYYKTTPTICNSTEPSYDIFDDLIEVKQRGCVKTVFKYYHRFCLLLQSLFCRTQLAQMFHNTHFVNL